MATASPSSSAKRLSSVSVSAFFAARACVFLLFVCCLPLFFPIVGEPLRIVVADEGARMAGGEPAPKDALPHPIGQRLQAERVGDMAAAFADRAGSMDTPWP